MLVIEGRIGKSRVLEQEMIKYGKGSFTIDAVGIAPIRFRSDFLAIVNANSYGERDEITDNILSNLAEQKDDLDDVKYIVLSLNTNVELLSHYRDFEKRIGKPFIITIQNDSLEEVRTYEY